MENQGPEQIAHSLGSDKPLKIKHLRDCESLVTGVMGRQALTGAVVEFSARVGTGAADD